MTNKEAIEKLETYFLTQEPKEVAKLCANFAVDINRWFNFEQLTEKEKLLLRERTRLNMQDVMNFINGKSQQTELKLTKYSESTV